MTARKPVHQPWARTVAVQSRMRPEEVDRVRECAAMSAMSLSTFIRDAVMRRTADMLGQRREETK